MAYLAIVAHNATTGRVEKYARLASAQEAQDHVAAFGGFAVETVIPIRNIVVVGSTVTDGGPPQAPVPSSVTKYQFQVALKRSGQLQNVKTALQDAGIDEEVKIYWDAAASIERQSLLIEALKGAMGLTDAQIDNFFRTAQEI